MRHRAAISLTIFLVVLSVFNFPRVWAEQVASPPVSQEKLTLERAFMCEGVEANSPYNQAVVFSAGLGRVFCFTHFDSVPENTFIFHNWYLRDKLHLSKKLSLRKPQWTTFSAISIRVNDKGPWRVEILDSGERRIRTLRFSIVD